MRSRSGALIVSVMLAVVMETLTELGVLPMAGVATSQLPPLAVVVVTVKPSDVPPPPAITDSGCAAGAISPLRYVKVRLVGVAETPAAAVMDRLTGTLTGWPPFGEI